MGLSHFFKMSDIQGLGSLAALYLRFWREVEPAERLVALRDKEILERRRVLTLFLLVGMVRPVRLLIRDSTLVVGFIQVMNSALSPSSISVS